MRVEKGDCGAGWPDKRVWEKRKKRVKGQQKHNVKDFLDRERWSLCNATEDNGVHSGMKNGERSQLPQEEFCFEKWTEANDVPCGKCVKGGEGKTEGWKELRR